MPVNQELVPVMCLYGYLNTLDVKLHRNVHFTQSTQIPSLNMYVPCLKMHQCAMVKPQTLTRNHQPPKPTTESAHSDICLYTIVFNSLDLLWKGYTFSVPWSLSQKKSGNHYYCNSGCKDQCHCHHYCSYSTDNDCSFIAIWEMTRKGGIVRGREPCHERYSCHIPQSDTHAQAANVHQNTSIILWKGLTPLWILTNYPNTLIRQQKYN